ncbi:MAG: type II secretion system protein GspG [Lentisphaerales bacterium]|nr:type II secretion system protein GspG [Lentisphaerales bacterium]
MSEKKANWPVTIGVGIAIGLAVLVILKQGTRMENDRQTYKVMIDLKALKSAIEQYKTEFGDYPRQQKGYYINFAEQLSKVQPSKDIKESREMFVDYNQYNMITSNPNYAAPNAEPTFLIDPWGEKYLYMKGQGSFAIWSTGADKVNSNASDDDISVHAVNKEKILKEREIKEASQ